MQNRLIAGVGALYIAAFLYTQIPYVQTLTILKGADQLFWNNLAILLILFVPAFIIMGKYIYDEGVYGAWGYLKVLLLFVAIVGFILNIFYTLIPIESVYNLPDFLDPFFASDLYTTIWLLAPLLLMIF